MHIPDGYLSPQTCAAMYAAAAPFWYTALRRVQRLLNTRLVPLLAVFSAFSFVIMMFNLPLPGGTTGHAVGMGVSAIVLGPWGSMLAVSVALLIQALFFGDGGVTAFGANCFNMAIVGSLTAYWLYRALAGRAAIMSGRRVVAAAIAGYAGINLAALCAAIEFGIQPALFKDAAGAPLYAPYPLSVAVPAMMIGHLTLAGLAELVVSGGVVAYLQRSDPALLRLAAPNAADADAHAQPAERRSGWRTVRPLLIGLAALMVISPLGLLAAGTAWGEWAPTDFNNALARQAIQAGSLNAATPGQAPAGLQRLSSFWTAPIPDYAPAFMQSAGFGYVLSAVFGAGLILLAFLLVGWAASAAGRARLRPSLAVGRAGATMSLPAERPAPTPRARKRRASFVERTINSLAEAMERALYAEEIARADGLLQPLDPRVKVVGLLALVVAAALARNILTILGLFAFALALALLSRVSLRTLATRVWLGALLFTGMLALPAIFITPGQAVYHLPLLGWPITAQGLGAATYLITRVETAATFSLLLILCTPWTHVLKALRVLRAPVVFVVILGMTYRYIFLMLQTAQDMFESRQSRMVGALEGADRRRLAGASVGVLLSKSMQLSSDVYMAMLSRGFRGEVYTLDDFRMRTRDWVALAGLLGAAALAFWLGLRTL